MRSLFPLAASAATLLLAGCTVGPDFEKPSSWSPGHWFDSTPDEKPVATDAAVPSRPVAEPIRADWWAVFADSELTTLEQRAAAANLDVRSATLNLAQSRAQRRITAADEFPQINGDASYQRQKPSPLGEFSLLSPGGNVSAGAGGATGAPSSAAIPPFNLYQYGFDASWELDLWGKVRRSVENADATIDASAEARRDTLLSVLAEVARDYLQLRQVQAELRIARENVATSEDSVRLTRSQAQNGLATDLDAETAAAQLSSVSATVPQLEAQEKAAINQLSFLVGEAPRTLETELSTAAPIPPVPPQVPIGLPSELAERRPDIREAEAKLHAATAEIGVAEAAFYPSVTLNGSDDIQATRFTNLANWNAHTYEFGPSLKIPIFEGGRLSGNLDLTKAEQQAAAIAFEKTVLNAWQEVDNALVGYDREQRRLAQLDQQVEQTGRALALARQQYTAGTSDFLRVLDAQRQVLSAEQQEADSRASVSLDLVTLYKALGGGWEAPVQTASDSK
jgi:NodT family efflux transporter outer membrane factor (OMF) lipoprotein